MFGTTCQGDDDWGRFGACFVPEIVPVRAFSEKGGFKMSELALKNDVAKHDSNPHAIDRLLVNSNSGCGSFCNFLLKLLPARIFSPQIMNPTGTKLSPRLMNANREQDHGIPSESTMLSTASGITAPAILRAAAHAASAEEAKIPYASATSS